MKPFLTDAQVDALISMWECGAVSSETALVAGARHRGAVMPIAAMLTRLRRLRLVQGRSTSETTHQPTHLYNWLTEEGIARVAAELQLRSEAA